MIPKRPPSRFEKYRAWWPSTAHPVAIEMEMIRNGGRFKRQSGKMVGEGLFFHFKEFIKLVWPEFVWHPWADLQVESWLNHDTIAVMGPASCVSGETRILNPYTGEQPTIESLLFSGDRPAVMTLSGPRIASRPFIKTFQQMFRVTLSNGESFKATADHRVLSHSGYVRVSELCAGCTLVGYDPFLQESISGNALTAHVSDERRWIEKPQDSQCDYPACSCSDDEPLPREAAAFQGAFQSQAYAQACMDRASSCEGDQGNKPSHSRPYPQNGPLSRRSGFPSFCNMGTICELILSSPFPHAAEIPSRDVGMFLLPFRSSSATSRLSSSEKPFCDSSRTRRSRFESSCASDRRSSFLDASYVQSWVQRVVVVKIEPEGFEPVYDLVVPVDHHYFAEGAIHHNSGKSAVGGICHLADYYVFPDCTTTLCCSTTGEMLENRVWGEIKKFHRDAKRRIPWLPGNLIESRKRIVTDNKDESSEGRDFRNGIQGVPCKKGNTYVGIADLVGIKNKRVRLMGDEISLLPPSFLDCLPNLRKNRDFKVTAMGNPKETTDPLGILAEPSAANGGWDGGIDQTGGTKTWETRQPRGIAIQLVGTDSPNLDGNLGIPLITQKDIDADMALYGRESWQYTMMNEGRMPRGQGLRRVLTRQLCLKNHAFDDPIWENTTRTKIASLDAAYRGVGGDRAVFTVVEFGNEAINYAPPTPESAITNREPGSPKIRHIIAMTDMLVIPVTGGPKDEPEDQIVDFVMSHCKARGIPPENFYYDSGMRTSLVSAFARKWSPSTNPVDCGGKPGEDKVSAQINVACKDYYSKFITQLWFDVRMAVESQQVRGMTEDVVREFAGREWARVTGNRIEVEPKSDMMKKTGRSPDLADSLAVAFYGARKSGFIISKLSPPEDADTNTHQWKRDLRDKARKQWRSGQLTFQ